MRALPRLTGLVFLLAFLAGCGPLYRTLVVIEPVKTGDYSVTLPEGLCTVEKAGVKLSLAFEPREKLEQAADFTNWNPYLNEQKYFFSVFKLTVENTGQEKIFVDTQKTVLLDGLGGQLNALGLDYFKSLYPVATVVQPRNTLRGDYFYDRTVIYTEDYYKYLIVDKTLFKNGELYPGVKREGYIVFERIRQEAGNITVNLPGITLNTNGSAEGRKMEELKFKFSHQVSVKEVVK